MFTLLSSRGGLLAALTAGALLAGCSGGDAAPAASGQPPVPVQLAEVKTGTIRSTLTYSGNVQSSQQVNLAPRTGGQVAAVFVDVGSIVKAGDRLATLDPGTLPAQVAQAQANLQAAQARLDSVLAGSRSGDIAAAQSAYDTAVTRLNQLQNPLPTDVAAADAAVTTARVAVDNATAGAATAKATLLGNVYIVCYQWGGFGVPCNNVVLPLPKEVTDSVASGLTTGIGQLGFTPGNNAIALLASNAAYQTALNNQATAEQALITARLRRDQLLSPSAGDLAAARTAVDAARSTLDKVKVPFTDSDIRGTRATVAQAEAALATVQTTFDQTTVTAPFDGVIAQRMAEVGAAASPAAPMFVISAKAVEVRLTVEEARIGLVRPDLATQLTVAAFPGKQFPGKVASVAPTGDPRAHTFEVKVFAQDPQAQLLPGMFAEVTMVTSDKASVLVIPASAIVTQGQTKAVVMVADGKAAFRPVQTGVSDTANVEVTSGLKAGDRIVVVGQNSVREGGPVAVATPGAATPTPTATAKP
jgi:HlyD family secretion protein